MPEWFSILKLLIAQRKSLILSLQTLLPGNRDTGYDPIIFNPMPLCHFIWAARILILLAHTCLHHNLLMIINYVDPRPLKILCQYYYMLHSTVSHLHERYLAISTIGNAKTSIAREETALDIKVKCSTSSTCALITYLHITNL